MMNVWLDDEHFTGVSHIQFGTLIAELYIRGEKIEVKISRITEVSE